MLPDLASTLPAGTPPYHAVRHRRDARIGRERARVSLLTLTLMLGSCDARILAPAAGRQPLWISRAGAINARTPPQEEPQISRLLLAGDAGAILAYSSTLSCLRALAMA